MPPAPTGVGLLCSRLSSRPEVQPQRGARGGVAEGSSSRRPVPVLLQSVGTADACFMENKGPPSWRKEHNVLTSVAGGRARGVGKQESFGD